MPRYRITRTEFHTRVWFVEAETEDEALESYIEEEHDEAESYHSGHDDTDIEEIAP